jgi:hypothetical protein
MVKVKSFGGRPRKRKAKPGERVHVGLRVSPELKRHLEDAAKQSTRSLSQEVEFRLESLFLQQDAALRALGGVNGAEAVRPLLLFFFQLDRAGIEWRGNKETAATMEACISVMTKAVVTGQQLSYNDWSQRIRAAYQGNVLADRGPCPKILNTASLIIQVFGLGELEPDRDELIAAYGAGRDEVLTEQEK